MDAMHETFEQHPWKKLTSASRLRRALSLAAVAAACLFFSLTLLLGANTSNAKDSTEAVTSSTAAPAPQTDFSRFTHTNPQHARLPCLLCHVRGDNSPRPVRSAGHTPCAGCHTQQFAESSGPVCTICHANPQQSAAVKPFPRLRSFNMLFDHATHARAGARPRSSCNACHRPQGRGGVALSIPAGLSAHTTCFACHTPNAKAGGEDIASCNTCHRLGGYRRTPETAPAFRVNFSHAEHTRKGLSCNECHTVLAGRGQGRQVTSPQPLMHHASARAQSCMTCHNDRRAFGGDDFSDCKRCHEGNTWHF